MAKVKRFDQKSLKFLIRKRSRLMFTKEHCLGVPDGFFSETLAEHSAMLFF